MMNQKQKICQMCQAYLGGFEIPIPERCAMCTDLVMFTLECIHKQSVEADKPLVVSEEDTWQGNGYDG